MFTPRPLSQICRPIQEAADRGPRDNVLEAKRHRIDRSRSTFPQTGQMSGSGRNLSHTTMDNRHRSPTQDSIASIEFSPSDQSSRLTQQLPKLRIQYSHAVRPRLFEKGLVNTRSYPLEPGTTYSLKFPRKLILSRDRNVSHRRRYIPLSKRT